MTQTMAAADIHRIGLMLGLACGLVVTPGCTQQRTSAAQQSASTDLFGDQRPEIDATKAYRSYSEVAPDVPNPKPQATHEAPTGRVQRSLERADALRVQKRFTEATIELERALRYEPDSPAAHRALALTLWETGNVDRAESHVQRALEAGGDDVVCHYILGRLAANQFKNQEAMRQFHVAMQCPVDDRTRPFHVLAEYRQAELLASEGYLTAAVELFESAQKGVVDLNEAQQSTSELEGLLRGGGAAIAEQIVGAYESLGRFDRAAEQLRRAYTGREMPTEVRIRYAKALARAGSMEAALAEARKLLGVDPSGRSILSAIYEQQGEPQRIVADLKNEADAHPDNEDSVLALAQGLDQFGDTAGSIDRLERFLSAHPQRLEVRWKLFELLRASNRFLDAFAVAADGVRTRSDWATEAAQKVHELANDAAAREAILGTGDASANGLTADFATFFLQGELALADNAENAGAYLNQAIADKPDFAAARVELGRIYLDRFAWQRALDVAAPAEVTLEPDTRLEFVTGSALAGLDRNEEAAAHFNTAIRLNRMNTDAMLALADLYDLTGESARSLRQLETLVEVDPVNEVAREKLFFAYLADGNRRAAAEQIMELKRLAAAPTRVARCVARMEYDRSSPDHERYRKTLRDAIAAYKPDSDTLVQIAESYVQERDFDHAVEALEQSLKLNPHHEPSIELLASCRYARLEYDDARALMQRLLEIHPDRFLWRSNLLHILTVMQRYEEAAALAALLVKEADGEQLANRFRYLAGELQGQLGHHDEQIALLRAWHEDQPDNGLALFKLIRALQSAGKHEEAIAVIREADERHPGMFARMDRTAEIWRAVPPEQHLEIEQMLMESLQIDPDSDIQVFSLLEFLTVVGRFDEALELVRNNIGAQHGYELYKRQEALTLERSGRLDEAITRVSDLIIEAGSQGQQGISFERDLRLDLYRLLTKAKRFRSAKEKLTRWIEEADAEGDLDAKLTYLNWLATCHQESGNTSDAIEVLKLAKELNPLDISLNNDLGYTLADAGKELDHAEEMIRLALASSPRTAAYLDSLGWVLYKKKDFSGARHWLSRARNTGDADDDGFDESADPVICNHLGDACWRLGALDEARHWWSESIHLAAVRAADQPAMMSEDVTESAQAKIDALAAGEPPKVAPTGPADP